MGFLTVAYTVPVSIGQEAHFLPSEKKDKEKKEKKKGRKTSAKDPDSLIQKKKKKVDQTLWGLRSGSQTLPLITPRPARSMPPS